MNTCQTCKWWEFRDDGSLTDIINPQDRMPDVPLAPDDFGSVYGVNETEIKTRYGHVMRHCASPRILFYQRPGIGGACVVDGSNYSASLLTSESFGCTLHER